MRWIKSNIQNINKNANCISMILKYNFESQFVVSLSPPLFSLCLLDFTLKMVQKTCVENKLFEGYKSVINIAVVLKQQEQMWGSQVGFISFPSWKPLPPVTPLITCKSQTHVMRRMFAVGLCGFKGMIWTQGMMLLSWRTENRSSSDLVLYIY